MFAVPEYLADFIDLEHIYTVIVLTDDWAFTSMLAVGFTLTDVDGMLLLLLLLLLLWRSPSISVVVLIR